MKPNFQTNPLISVVMPTYNGEQFISEAITSILEQTFSNFELIIVDDGSSDATQTIVKSFLDDRIVYLKKETNTGIADSLNIGISKARGEFIARMDDDDISFSERFEKQLDVFRANPELIFCGTNVQDEVGKPNTTPEFHNSILLKLLFFKNPIFHPTALIKKDFLLQHPYNMEMVPAEDHDLWSRLIFKGKFYQIQEPLFFVRLHQTSTTARRRQEQLKLNIVITKRVFDGVGFERTDEDDRYIEILASHDYGVSEKTVKYIVKWLEKLKHINKEVGFFDVVAFNNEADFQFKRYLKSYFLNNSKLKKIIVFFSLKTRNKAYILNYYFNSFFKAKLK